MSTSLDGFLLLDKPPGLTSAQVVRRISGIGAGARCGHLGTLDPLATGLLVVCIGNALKLVPYLVKGRKRYVAEIAFGTGTDTFDAQGTAVERAPVPANLHHKISKVLPDFLGTQQQTPPAYSAIKVNGTPLYKLARKGRHVEPSPREVTFFSIRIVSRQECAIVLDVVCSAGTYIRSLAHDLGVAVKCPATLASLRRLESAPFSIEQAVPFEAIEAGRERIDSWLHPLEEYLPPLPRLTLNPDAERRVRHGRALTGLQCKDGDLLLLSEHGRLVAIGEGQEVDSSIRIKRVVDTP